MCDAELPSSERACNRDLIVTREDFILANKDIEELVGSIIYRLHANLASRSFQRPQLSGAQYLVLVTPCKAKLGFTVACALPSEFM